MLSTNNHYYGPRILGSEVPEHHKSTSTPPAGLALRDNHKAREWQIVGY
jgi:hypothetical protein